MANINKNNRFQSTNNRALNGHLNDANNGALRISSGPGINGNKNSENSSNIGRGKPRVDPADPQVRKLVYNMYRGLLDKKHEQANSYLDTLPKTQVAEDKGVTDRVQNMM